MVVGVGPVLHIFPPDKASRDGCSYNQNGTYFDLPKLKITIIINNNNPLCSHCFYVIHIKCSFRDILVSILFSFLGQEIHYSIFAPFIILAIFNFLSNLMYYFVYLYIELCTFKNYKKLIL